MVEMNNTHIMVYKPAGITMNQLILDYKNKNNIAKICFAGRLDPMARGNCLFLFNEECKKIDNYKNLDKTYQFKIIIGLQTDSDDPLGLIQNIRPDLMTEEQIIKLKNNLTISETSEIIQKFHKFSTKCFNQKDKTKEPSHLVSIYSYQIGDEDDYEKYDFHCWKEQIISQINTIDPQCNFNQSNIITQWDSIISIKELYAIPVTLTVSSGFYVRQFVRDLSEKIGIPLMVYDINRISILFA
jgi:tRNA U55 pseudouridine synthase TruB